MQIDVIPSIVSKVWGMCNPLRDDRSCISYP